MRKYLFRDNQPKKYTQKKKTIQKSSEVKIYNT